MTPQLSLRNIKRSFTRKLDGVERLAVRLGWPVPPTVHAVDGVSLDIDEGEVVGLVGESGCGKSTLGRVVAGIHDKTSGEFHYDGVSQDDWTRAQQKRARLEIQMIFQDPMSSLNPRIRVGEAIGEAPRCHGAVPASETREYVASLMAEVGLDPSYADRFPHQFSGGQRQRIGIARALAVQPKVLVCDEAVAALDVSIQAQVLNLLMDLRERRRLTYLFISHDLGVVEHLSDRVAVMYLGRIVELAPTADLFTRPLHPYTMALLKEAPRIGRGRRTYQPLKGEIPSPIAPPPGCHFHTRCPFAIERCRIEAPKLVKPVVGREVACHRYQDFL